MPLNTYLPSVGGVVASTVTLYDVVPLANVGEILYPLTLKLFNVASLSFFSSSVLTTITDGILAFIRNGGHIRLIASPSLSQEDVNAINLGYKQRAKLIEDFFSHIFLIKLYNLYL